MFCFNFFLVLVNIICFSAGFLNLSFHSSNSFEKAFSITLIIMSILSFFYINYKFLTSGVAKHGYTIEEVSNSDDYIEILQSHRSKACYQHEIFQAIDQIERMNRKKDALDHLLYQKFQEDNPQTNQYHQIIEDANQLMFRNIKRFINLLAIFDQREYDQLKHSPGGIPPSKLEIYQENEAYVKDLIAKNEIILLDFDRLLLEISKIGDTEEADEINLQRISDIAANLKKLRVSEEDSLRDKYR